MPNTCDNADRILYAVTKPVYHSLMSFKFAVTGSLFLFSICALIPSAASAQGVDNFFPNKDMENKFIAFQNQRELLVQKNPKLSKIITLAKAKDRKKSYLSVCKNNPYLESADKEGCQSVIESFCKYPYSVSISVSAAVTMIGIYTSVTLIEKNLQDPKAKEAGANLIKALYLVRQELSDHLMALANISDGEHMK